MSWHNWKNSFTYRRLLHNGTTKHALAMRTWAECAKQFKHKPNEYEQLCIALKVELHKFKSVINNMSRITARLDVLDIEGEKCEKQKQESLDAD